MVPGSRREHRSWYFYDWASSAFSTTVVTVFFGPYLTSVAQSATSAGESIRLLGIIPVTAESYLPYVISLSVILQVLLLPIIGAVADRSEAKRLRAGTQAFQVAPDPPPSPPHAQGDDEDEGQRERPADHLGPDAPKGREGDDGGQREDDQNVGGVAHSPSLMAGARGAQEDLAFERFLGLGAGARSTGGASGISTAPSRSSAANR